MKVIFNDDCYSSPKIQQLRHDGWHVEISRATPAFHQPPSKPASSKSPVVSWPLIYCRCCRLLGQSYLKLAHKTQSQDKWLANAILFVTDHAAHTARRAASGCDIRNPDITLDPVVAANTTARSCARRYESRSSAVMAATETKFAVNSRVNAVMTFSLIDLPEGTSRTILITPLVQTASPAPFCDDGRDCARLSNIPELLGQIMESVHTALWCAGCNNCTGISHHCSR
jgi:hypothetical protein